MAKSRSKKRRYLVANWKMNKTTQEATVYFEELLSSLSEVENTELWFSVPFTAIHAVANSLEKTSFCVGAQNMNDSSPGAFTGEIAAEMIQKEGCSFVLLGHSERRRFFQETDEMINKKVQRALEIGIIPIVCIGETLQERESGRVDEALEAQITKAFEGCTITSLKKKSFLIAYEPVWAIGTGKSATPEMVEETHISIRSILQKIMPKVSEDIPLLYGGSVSEKNIIDLATLPNVQGFLVGTASLQAETFAKIITAYDKAE